MSIFRRGGVRRDTMPRVRPEPEANKVQKPELLRSMAQRLGMRQMHVAPTVAPEVQPVIVLEDLSRQAQQTKARFAAFVAVGGTGTPNPTWILFNPPTSGRIVSPRRCGFSRPHGNIINFAISGATTNLFTVKLGVRLRRGNAPDDGWPSLTSDIGLQGGEVLNSGLPTFYEQSLADGTTTLTQMPFERTFDSLFLYPGSQLVMYWDGTTFDTVHGTMEWDEERIT